MTEAIAVCDGCGTPYAGYFDDSGRLLVQGRPDCPSCGGTSFTEANAADVTGHASDRRKADDT